MLDVVTYCMLCFILLAWDCQAAKVTKNSTCHLIRFSSVLFTSFLMHVFSSRPSSNYPSTSISVLTFLFVSAAATFKFSYQIKSYTFIYMYISISITTMLK